MTTKTITIQGLEFEVNQPYAEGHILTAAEAKALNQVRAENIRNNTARKIEAAKAEAGGDLTQQAITALAAEVAAYDAQYDFTLATGGGSPRVTDPVEREALSIARTLVRAQAKKEGRKILKDEVEPTSESDITKVRFLELVEGLAAREDVVKEARRRVKATEAIAA